MSSNLVEIAKSLPLAERVQLMEALWESIAEDGYEPPLTAEQATELDQRLEAHRRNPNEVVSWESIRDELNSKYSKR